MGRARRAIVNTVLVYAIAAVVTLVTVTLAHGIGPEAPGPGIGGYLVYAISLLAIGAPGMLAILAILDAAIVGLRRRRLIVVAVALIPATGYGLLALASDARSGVVAGTLAWLIAVGLGFGLAMRLPKRTDEAGPDVDGAIAGERGSPAA